MRRDLLGLLQQVARERRVEIRELEVAPAHAHLLVDVDPRYGIHRLVKQMTDRSSHVLRARCRSLPTPWTNRYVVATTGGAPLAVIKRRRQV